MGANSDYLDLFRELNEGSVRFLVVGGYAVIFHTEPRYTKDVDVWVEPSAENANRVFAALQAFGAPLEGVRPQDFTDTHLIYQIGVEPNRIDVIMGVPGLDFAPAYERANRASYGSQPIRVLSLDDLVSSKKAAARPQDLVDVERLEEKLRTLGPKKNSS